MKKTLLSLFSLLALCLQGYSQGTPAISSFTPQASNLGANDIFVEIQAVDANTAWALAGPEDAPGTYLRTTNGGATWQKGSLIPTGFVGYSAGDLFALNATTAFAALFSNGNGGLIVRTTDGGATWAPVTTPGLATTAGTQFGAPLGFANWVHFFDAQNGICMGDPNASPTSGVVFFEVYTTSDGGTTWNRVPRSAGLSSDADDYGVTRQYSVVGNTIWFTTLYDPATITSPARVFKSTDRGLTWTNYTTNIPNRVDGVAFANANNGLIWNNENLSVTRDGGATWNTQTYSTPFRSADVKAIPGGNVYVAVGTDATVASPSLANIGTSISRDYGATWQTIDNQQSYATVSFVSGTVGWAAGLLPRAANGFDIGKYTGANILSNRNAELQKSLAAYPNPSANGIFTVQLASGLKSGAKVRVLDVVGREVATQQLNATAIAAKSTTVDLSKERAGVYTLELRTDAGVAQQKLVVQ
jgi:photosystem II stability/assembly factor-like uncharacterized protein